ncbi:hypothetical protein GW17_00049049, partial [Ensete ventricosum]
MDEENTGPFRRTSSRTKKIAAKMAAALASADNRTQVDSVSRAFAALARLESLENDNAGAENMEINDDDDASLDDDDQVVHTGPSDCRYRRYIPVHQITGTCGTYRSVRLPKKKKKKKRRKTSAILARAQSSLVARAASPGERPRPLVARASSPGERPRLLFLPREAERLPPRGERSSCLPAQGERSRRSVCTVRTTQYRYRTCTDNMSVYRYGS